MRTTYEIIVDQNQLIDFIDWLPELNEGEAFCATLFARKKYAPVANLKSDKAQLTRIVAQDKDWLLNKIRRMEVSLGSYFVKGVEVPQESLALYITQNPRCLIKATKDATRRLQELSWMKYNGYNPHAETMSCIQRAKSRTVWVDFDFDVEYTYLRSILKELKHHVNMDATKIISSRGGYHVMVNPSLVLPEHKNTWFKGISSMVGVDSGNIGDNMIPVVGTYQGGHVPTFLN